MLKIHNLKIKIDLIRDLTQKSHILERPNLFHNFATQVKQIINEVGLKMKVAKTKVICNDIHTIINNTTSKLLEDYICLDQLIHLTDTDQN